MTMVLDLIHQLKDQYKKSLIIGHHRNDNSQLNDIDRSSQMGQFDNWISLKTFQSNWNTDTLDFKSMYANSFANSLTNDLWEGQSFFPKKSMLAFIDRDPVIIHTMFSELYNENLDIEGRIDRFVYHCDEISRDIMRTNPHYQSHYHDGYRMISVYLAFRYPMQYTIYSYPEYKSFMALVKARAVPTTRDIGRFFKTMRTVYGIISKDEELLAVHRELRAGRDDLYQGESLLLVRDFYWFCGSCL